jgi:biopolymer transport protein ExbD
VRLRSRRELKKTRIEVIPMIDTIFFLLVFFMLSSLSMTRLNGLPVNLPTATTATKQPIEPVTITIDKERQVFVNKQAVTLGELAPRVREIIGASGAPLERASIVLNADLDAPHGLVVHVMDACRSAGISKFAIATEPEPSVAPAAPPATGQ